MTDDPTPTPLGDDLDPDDRVVLLGMVTGFARSLGRLHRGTPDLIEGFLAGRYELLVGNESLTVLVAGDYRGPDLLLD